MIRDDGGVVFNIHGHGMQAPGWPDLYIALPSTTVYRSWQGWVELKVRKNKPTALQAHRIKQLQEVGCPACVLRLIEWPLCTLELKGDLDYERLIDTLGEPGEL